MNLKLTKKHRLSYFWHSFAVLYGEAHFHALKSDTGNLQSPKMIPHPRFSLQEFVFFLAGCMVILFCSILYKELLIPRKFQTLKHAFFFLCFKPFCSISFSMLDCQKRPAARRLLLKPQMCFLQFWYPAFYLKWRKSHIEKNDWLPDWICRRYYHKSGRQTGCPLLCYRRRLYPFIDCCLCIFFCHYQVLFGQRKYGAVKRLAILNRRRCYDSDWACLRRTHSAIFLARNCPVDLHGIYFRLRLYHLGTAACK